MSNNSLYMRYLCLFLLFISAHSGRSQNLSEPTKDSLLSKSFSYLKKRFETVPTYEEAFVYATAILKKAKQEENLHKAVEAYELIAYYYENETETAFTYADSMQTYSEKVGAYRMEDALILRGYLHQKNRAYTKAIENYTKAYPFAVDHSNKKAQFKIRYNIANIDKSIGDYTNAQSKLQECYALLNSEAPLHDIYKINTLLSLATIYEKNGRIDSSYYYTDLGVKEAKKIQSKGWESIFKLNQGVLLYHEKKFKESIALISKLTPTLSSFYASKGHYYLGSANHALNDTDAVIAHFIRMDSLLHAKKITYPEARSAYKLLIQHFENKNDLTQAFKYSKRLTTFDSIQNVNFKHLNNKIIQGYNIPQYQQTISVLSKTKKTYKTWIIVAICIILIFVLFFVYQYRKQKFYKRRFEALMIQQKETNDSPKSPTKVIQSDGEKKLNLPQHIIDEILQGLRKFESDKSFLITDITLNGLAKKLHTNHTYLSRVINFYEDKGFVSYINDLRIEYALDEFVKNKSFKKYTITAIAKECGFNSARSFNRAFHRKTGIQASYFIKQLDS